MAYSLNTKTVELAFSSGQVLDQGKPVQFEVVVAGSLLLSSGLVSASDPLVDPNPSPFTQPAPVGSHPLLLAIARFENGDERIAFAQLKFGNSPAVRWQMATVNGQKEKSLAEDEFFGYGVDSGTGCFMDSLAGKLLEERMNQEDEYFNQIIEGMEATYKHTRSWFNFCPSKARSENIICFSTGFGDGMYPSFFGFSSGGEVVSLVTDFCILSDDQEGQDSESSKRPWWKIW